MKKRFPSLKIQPQRKLFNLLFILLFSCSYSQNDIPSNARLVGGPCEGCEAVFEYGKRELSAVDTLPDFEKEGQQICISGTIYEADGKTPAENVILYVYHTNQVGIYPTKGDEKGWAKKHGYIRGWMKTGKDGKYTFYTLKPGTYPSRTEPAHIHPIILEPGGKYYYLGSYFFEGDPLLSENEINPSSPRGRSKGVIDLKKENGIHTGTRDIILGANIPGY